MEEYARVLEGVLLGEDEGGGLGVEVKKGEDGGDGGGGGGGGSEGDCGLDCDEFGVGEDPRQR